MGMMEMIIQHYLIVTCIIIVMLTLRILFSHSKLQEKIVKHSLPYVHKFGWTDNAILAAVNNLDLSPASHRLIRPFDLIAYSMKEWNQMALRAVDDTNFEGRLKIKDKIHYAIKYIDTWNQAMAIGAHPDHVCQTKDLLWQYSDEIWRRCGDTSTDYNYYTKRILFNTAYATTELHLLTDQSPNRQASWQFLDRRLSDILKVGKTVNDLKVVGNAAFDGLLGLMGGIKTPPHSEVKVPIQEVRNSENKGEEEHQNKSPVHDNI